MLTFPLKPKSVQSLLFKNLVFILDLTSSFLLIVSFLFRVLGMPEAELDVMSVSSHFSPASPASIMLWFPPLYIMVAWCMRRGEDRSCMSSWCPQWQMWPAPHFCMYVRPCICAYASASQKKKSGDGPNIASLFSDHAGSSVADTQHSHVVKSPQSHHALQVFRNHGDHNLQDACR